ncbi:MAG: hypothetical protein EON55_16395 [Alphaproteobacteria bacterium]|nr:MAG: hypothetical protein EON55_16395 [Alphaproteobacteria bacterium]
MVGACASDLLRAGAGCRILGVTLGEVRDPVCPPRLHAGFRLSDGQVRADDRILRIVDDRDVTCLLPPERWRRVVMRARKAA